MRCTRARFALAPKKSIRWVRIYFVEKCHRPPHQNYTCQQILKEPAAAVAAVAAVVAVVAVAVAVVVAVVVAAVAVVVVVVAAAAVAVASAMTLAAD